MTKFCEHAHADRTFEIKLVGLFISFLAKAVESEKKMDIILKRPWNFWKKYPDRKTTQMCTIWTELRKYKNGSFFHNFSR